MFLEIKNYGINIILSSKWLMVVPISNPYMVQKDTPIYLDPLIYIGYVVIPVLNQVWPQTGNLELNAEKWAPSQILAHCNNN